MYQFIVRHTRYVCKVKQRGIWIRFSSNNTVRVRFAPSPTGLLHIGGLRTALYNYLFAKSFKDGKFIIRIEDTDQTRIVPGATEHLHSILKWAGVVPDESPMHGGAHGPYVQSERLHYYTKHVGDLLRNGSAYRCFCSPRRLMLLKKEQRQRKETSRYDNRCRSLSAEQIEENLGLDKPYAIRLKIDEPFLSADDMLYDRIKINSCYEGDPVLLKSDGFPTYHLANVVDDHLMEISHVIRGREWLISTPKHVFLYKRFGWTPPKFLHLPLLINADGTKLSKRQNDINVEYFKENGYSPSSLVNFMVYCGSGFKGQTFPVLSPNHNRLLRTLTATFDPNKLLQSDAIMDIKKLEDFSRTLTCHLIDTGSHFKLQELINNLFDLVLKNYGDRCIFVNDDFSADDIRSYLLRIVKLRKTHIVKPSDLATNEYDFLWMRPTDIDFDSHFKEVLFDAIKFFENSDFNSFDYSIAQNRMKELAGIFNLKFSSIMKFLRVCLTGKQQGPTLFDIVLMLGQSETLVRLRQAQDYCCESTSTESETS